MHTALRLAVPVLLVGPLSAQGSLEDLLTPSPETKQFDVFLGAWEGAGTAKGTTEEEAMRFTVKANARRVLGGHFVREDSLFQFAGMEESPIAFRSYHGWDRENKRYITVQMANDGSVQNTEMDWIDAKTVTSQNTVKMGDQVFHETYTVRFKDKDRYTLTGYRSVNGAKPFLHIQGDYRRRVSKIENASLRARPLPIESQGVFGPEAKPLPFAKGIAGRYRMQGKMIPVPGAPLTEIAAEEIVKPIFGRSILLFRTKGVPNMGFAYEGVSALAFDATRNRYKMVYVNNMGECGEVSTWFEAPAAAKGQEKKKGGRLVSTWSGTRYGQAMVQRSVMALDETGAIREIAAHSITGSMPPVLSFEGAYEKVR